MLSYFYGHDSIERQVYGTILESKLYYEILEGIDPNDDFMSTDEEQINMFNFIAQLNHEKGFLTTQEMISFLQTEYGE